MEDDLQYQKDFDSELLRLITSFSDYILCWVLETHYLLMAYLQM